MINQEIKSQILESMKNLIKDGETITTENYSGQNPEAFKEFAETNGFKINDVIDVYSENESLLDDLFNEITEK